MLDRITIGIEQCGVPITQCLMAFCAMEWKTNVAAGEVEFGILSGHQNHGRFIIRSVMAGSGFGHVYDCGVVERRAVSFGNGLELIHQGMNLIHVMGLDYVAHEGGASIGIPAAVADRVDIGLFCVLWQGGDLSAQVIYGIGHDVG